MHVNFYFRSIERPSIKRKWKREKERERNFKIHNDKKHQQERNIVLCVRYIYAAAIEGNEKQIKNF